MASAEDVVVQLKGIISQLGAWVKAYNGRWVTGTFTAAAAASTTITQPAVTSTSVIFLSATNASAGTLMGSNKSLYISARTPGASFAVTTASGVAAAGTETFSYLIFNPS